MSDSSHYHDALLEEIRADVKGLAEAFRQMRGDVDSLKSDMAEVKNEMRLWRALWTDHEKRISKLETA